MDGSNAKIGASKNDDPPPTLPRLIRRLDMENFVLAGPESTDNTCMNDEFYVTGGSTTLPTVCGTNSGQHSKTCNWRESTRDNIEAD